MTDDRPVSKGPRQDPKLGHRLQILSYVVGIIGGIIMLALVGGPDALKRGDLKTAVFGLGMFALLYACFYIHEYGQRHLEPSADSAVSSDRRRPVLYLRSFEDESTVHFEERALADIMEDVGPFVAVGRPEDRLPPLGASRKYLPEGPWRPHVQELLDRSALVILVAGQTHGLNWELAECRRRVSPDRLVVLVRSDPASYEVFRSQFEKSEDRLRLPAFPDRKAIPHHAGGFCGVVRFDANWNGRLVPFQKAAWLGSGYEITDASTGMRNRLQLAFSEITHGMPNPVRHPGTNWVKILIWAFLAFLVLSMVVVIAWLAQTRFR